MRALALWIPSSGQLFSNSTSTPEKVSETELLQLAYTYNLGATDTVDVDINTDECTAVFKTCVFGKTLTVTMHSSRVTFIE